MKLKKLVAAALSGLCLAVAACAPAEPGSGEDDVPDTPEYDLARYMAPVWEGTVTYNESVLLLLNKQGDFDPMQLLYDATEIVSVRSSRLDKLYEPGVDYWLENGKLKLNRDSGYNKLGYMDYYINFEQAGGTVLRSVNDGYLYYMEGSFYHDRQIAVTYRHRADFPEDRIPPGKGNLLKKVNAKFRDKRPVKIALYGASNDTGCNSSAFLGVAPHAPIYSEMLEAQLRAVWGYDEITIDNSLSLGGMATNYGVEKLDELVAQQADLVIVDFGINDAYFNTVETYRRNMKTIVDRIQSDLPEADIVLAHGPLTNPEHDYAPNRQLNESLALFGEELYALEGEGVAVADLCRIDAYLLTRKRFGDMTGNNINHNNDFKARVVAQTLLKTLQIGD